MWLALKWHLTVPGKNSHFRALHLKAEANAECKSDLVIVLKQHFKQQDTLHIRPTNCMYNTGNYSIIKVTNNWCKVGTSMEEGNRPSMVQVSIILRNYSV